MVQTDDLLRTLQERPMSRPEAADQTERHAEVIAVLGSIAVALERIANAIEPTAMFSQLLTSRVPREEASNVGFDDYREEPDGLKVLVGGAWRPATLAEEQEIADMNQKRKRR